MARKALHYTMYGRGRGRTMGFSIKPTLFQSTKKKNKREMTI